MPLYLKHVVQLVLAVQQGPRVCSATERRRVENLSSSPSRNRQPPALTARSSLGGGKDARYGCPLDRYSVLLSVDSIAAQFKLHELKLLEAPFEGVRESVLVRAQDL